MHKLSRIPSLSVWLQWSQHHETLHPAQESERKQAQPVSDFHHHQKGAEMTCANCLGACPYFCFVCDACFAAACIPKSKDFPNKLVKLPGFLGCSKVLDKTLDWTFRIHRLGWSKNPARWSREGIKLSPSSIREAMSLDGYLSFDKKDLQRLPFQGGSFSRLWMLRQLWND